MTPHHSGLCQAYWRLLLGDDNPLLPIEVLLGPEVGLVLHFLTPIDPVAEVQVRDVDGHAQLDLLQDAVSTQSTIRLIGVEKGIDRRQTFRSGIGHCNCNELTFQPGLDKQGFSPRIQQKAFKVLRIRIVHAAIVMTRGKILLIQMKVLIGIPSLLIFHAQIIVSFQIASVGASMPEVLAVDSYRHTR